MCWSGRSAAETRTPPKLPTVDSIYIGTIYVFLHTGNLQLMNAPGGGGGGGGGDADGGAPGAAAGGAAAAEPEEEEEEAAPPAMDMFGGEAEAGADY
jgi:hypothetical protein